MSRLISNRNPFFVPAYYRPGASSSFLAGGEQPQEKTKWGSIAALGGTLAGITALGFVPIGHNRIGDYYLRGIRALEEVSPAKIFRTFQYSELLSPLGSNRAFSFPPNIFSYSYQRGSTLVTAPNRIMRRFASNMFGRPVAELEQLGVFSQGLEFRRTGLIFGELGVKGGPVLSRAALPLKIGSHAGGSFIDWYARVSGIRLGMTESVTRISGAGMAAVTVPKLDKVLGIPISDVAQVYLQKTRVLTNITRAYARGQVARLNRLLMAPTEWFPGLNRFLKASGLPKLPIKLGTVPEMLGRYAAKGLVIAGAYQGFKYLSYLRSQSDNKFLSGVGFGAIGGALGGLLRQTGRGAAIGAAIGAVVGIAPLFDRGIAEGAATAYTRAMMGYTKASQAAGLTKSRQEQEALMPGITKAKTFLGLTAAGMMLGLFGGYGLKLASFKKMGIEGTTAFMEKQAGAIGVRAAAVSAARGGKLGRIAGWFAGKTGAGAEGGLAGRVLMRGGWIGGMLGALSYGLLAIGAAWSTGNLLPGILGAKHTPKELERLYTGREEVPVRAGKWWEFGRSSWEGGRIKYYKPHWYHLLMSKAKVKGLWGSEEERWAASPLLHPIKALTDEEFKYRWEREHYYSRPFPLTSTYGGDVPFIAPLTEAIGSLIKRPKLMHTEEWLAASSLDSSRLGNGAVLHIPTAGDLQPSEELGGYGPGTPVSKFRADQQIGEFIYRLNELRGLPGFIHGAVKEVLTGSQDYFDQLQQLETSARATGYERRYWDLELGGALGLTEGFRRFLPHRRRQIELYNPIRNQMPDWMVGPEYFLDLQHGDPFSRVQGGEFRLPGPGYTALHPELVGLEPSEYPLFHRFKILADVAMYSDKFKQTKREMRSAIRRGEISKDQVEQFDRINEQVSEKKKRKTFTQYRFAQDILEEKRITVAEILPSGLIRTEKQGIIGLGGVEIRADKGTEGYRRKQAQVSDYLREYIQPGMELDVFTHRDPLHRFKKGEKGYYQPAIITANGVNLGERLVDADIMKAADDEDPFAIRAKYNNAQRMLGSLWEHITHYESPREYLLPLSPKAKFIHHRSAIEEYERSRVFGTESAFWQHPIKHFLRPAASMVEREWLGTKDIPEDVKRRRAIEDYFDRLKWMKYKILERAAASMNDQESIKEFKAQQRRTLFGVNPYGSLSYVYSAMPSLDRDYYEAFKDAQTKQERATIMELIAPNQRQLYMATWRNQLATALRSRLSIDTEDNTAKATLDALNIRKFAEGREITPALWKEYKQEVISGETYADWSRRKEAAEYFTTKAPLPGPNWVGWHPSVDLEDVKLKLIDNIGEQIHDYNLWPSRRQGLVGKPYITEEPLTAGIKHPSELAKAIEGTLRDVLKLGNVQVHVLPSSTNEDEVHLEIADNRKHALMAYKNDPTFAYIA